METGYENYVFDFEKLEVYQLAVKFISNVFGIYRKLPQEYKFSVGAQFTRASLSIANNIAEGSGKVHKKEKHHFYGTSLDSARECIPMITVLKAEKQISAEEHDNMRSAIIEICNKLVKLRRAIHIE